MSAAPFEKVEKGLEHCSHGVCILGDDACHYFVEEGKCHECVSRVCADALFLIRSQQARIKELEAAQTARVMTLEELSDWTHINPRERKPIYWENRCEQHESQWMLEMKNLLYMLEAIKKKVGRCWTARPTDEQRKAVTWE